MNFKIADFNIEIDNNYSYLEKMCFEYSASCDNADLKFSVEETDLIFEQGQSDTDFSLQYLETIAAYRKIAECLPLHSAFLLHSAVFDVNGTGVAFAAHSGTGKTTHMLLWQKLLGEKMKIVNGDKPIIRFFENEPQTPYAYGTPWNGKEHLGCNMRTPLKHICFIERAEQNSCEKMEPKDAVDRIFNQVYMPKDPAAMVNTIQLINRLINSCQLWKIKCNMDLSAAETAYNTIFGKEEKL